MSPAAFGHDAKEIIFSGVQTKKLSEGIFFNSLGPWFGQHLFILRLLGIPVEEINYLWVLICKCVNVG